MNDHQAAINAICDRAIAARGTKPLGIVIDGELYAKSKKPTVIVAVARPNGVIAVAVDAAEFSAEQRINLWKTAV